MAISAAEREVAGGAAMKVIPAADAEGVIGRALAAGDLGWLAKPSRRLDVKDRRVVDELPGGAEGAQAGQGDGRADADARRHRPG